MLSYLERTFQRIGADIRVITRSDPLFAREVPTVAIDVIERRGSELFEIAIREREADRVQLSVLEVKPQDRHLVLLSRILEPDGAVVRKEHFLCGHDERHLFVAAVEAVSTVAAAKASLKPHEILHREVGKNVEKANRRKTDIFRRQGEWFFLPAEVAAPASLILRNEPLVRGRGSKPHIAQFAYRYGGEPVKVCSKYPQGVTLKQFESLIRGNQRAKNWGWTDMRRNAAVYVMGYIRHPDHATIVLDGWHRVLMNREARSATVAFLD
jgi:hypothetical protein